MKFEHKIVLITGGARGFGRAFAETILREGGRVAIVDVDGAAAEATRAELSGVGEVRAYECDVADEHAVERTVAQVAEDFGGIDILINNAAKHLMEYSRPPLQLGPEKWRLMLEVNVVGIVNCTASCVPHMKKRGGGVVLNLSSMAGFEVTGAYGVSKLAVRGLTVALAHELGSDGIRVVGIAPGFMDTPAAMADVPEETARYIRERLKDIKRQGRVEDVVNAMVFLCTEQSSFITGETLLVSGGAARRV